MNRRVEANKMNNQPIYLDVPEAIKKELEQTIPFIHQKEKMSLL